MHANEHAHTTHATAFDRHAGGAARSHAGHAHDPIQQGPIQETPTMSGDQANAPAGAPVGGDWLQRVTDVLLASVELAEAESRQVYRKGHAWCAQLAIGIAAGFLLLMAVGALTASVWYLGNFVSGPILGWAMAGGMLTLVGVAVGLIALFWPSRLRHA